MAKIITIAQQKGGSGKSTLAAHLAIGLRQSNFKVTLIDIDSQGSLTKWYEIRSQLLGAHNAGIDFAHCPGMRVASEVEQYKPSSDFIIIDCPPHTDTETKTAIRVADLVLIPIQPSPTDIWASQATINFAKEENKIIRILMNRYNPNTNIAKEIKIPKEYLYKTHLGNRVIFASSIAHGKTALEAAPQSAAAVEVKLLVGEVLTTLKML